MPFSPAQTTLNTPSASNPTPTNIVSQTHIKSRLTNNVHAIAANNDVDEPNNATKRPHLTYDHKSNTHHNLQPNTTINFCYRN